ncbi:MAG: glycosyl hydrolase [Candidatus Rokuibacteriota bacterium]|nr:MAG: hypothetical protein AUH14_03805 [Candidatus Rokubacteria bacterium 13_2_20CM_69_15_1]OLB52245.1 MAG: hypothetical protein AUH99_05580 [Candidatus Rokubacteria bacterium 13_2_20CM_2_70_11]PYN35336.1 MAG: glycosyl hydrolase [Candidatus Rokubacteria bacterium]
MVTRRSVAAKGGDVVLLVGTLKGAFFLRAPATRTAWAVEGPYLPGRAVYALAHDGREGRQRIWASAASMHWGAVLVSTDDWGRTWTEPPEANVKFPVESGLALKQIWQITPGRADEPDTLYCGVEPAALFRSTDGGKAWTVVRGLLDHPHRPRWTPGGGGLCLHTIVTDPVRADRMWVAISTGGVYRTDDGGRTWAARNVGIRAEFLPEKYPEFGQCVHKIVQPPRGKTLFLQNHWGLYRSDDGGDSWQDVARGVPSDFGFAMAAHPHDPDTVYVLPLESDQFRCPPEGKLRVYRTRSGGRTWEPLSRGLPQQRVYETVLRDAMTTDALDPVGVYFGTRNGKLFASNDGGGSWRLTVDSLPPVVCVRAVGTDDARGRRKTSPRSARR